MVEMSHQANMDHTSRDSQTLSEHSKPALPGVEQWVLQTHIAIARNIFGLGEMEVLG
jgi:hypothetical protein